MPYFIGTKQIEKYLFIKKIITAVKYINTKNTCKATHFHFKQKERFCSTIK